MRNLTIFSSLLLLASSISSVSADTVVVDTFTDGDDGECMVDCTLREAVVFAANGDEILLPAGVYSLSLGALVIDRDLSVTGAGARQTIVETTTGGLVFDIDSATVLAVRGDSWWCHSRTGWRRP